MIKPEEVIKRYSVEELCETADAYFRAITDPTHQLAKPFSSVAEAPEILLNMGLLLSGLHLGKTMTVLEFASGTCWFSRYLSQLRCQTISCDVSRAALEIGQRLFADYPIVGGHLSEPKFLHFDGHRLDLPDESVDRIVCHDGFHHVPNQEQVISELARVLRPGGVAGFSEPGRFHSQTPQSQFEMGNFTVLENDVVITEIFDIAQRHGFTDCKIKLLSDMVLSIDEWKALTTQSVPPAPPTFGQRVKALMSTATEPPAPTVIDRVSDNIRQVLINKTIFFLHKGDLELDSRSHEGLAHLIATDSDALQAKAGKTFQVPLKITNTGRARWLGENINDIGVVKICVHLYDSADNLVEINYSKHDIGCDVVPGQTIERTIDLAIAQPGTYRIAVDLGADEICWFENVGSKTKSITLQID